MFYVLSEGFSGDGKKNLFSEQEEISDVMKDGTTEARLEEEMTAGEMIAGEMTEETVTEGDINPVCKKTFVNR